MYYKIQFLDETRREKNSFKLRNLLSDKCNQKVEELSTDSKNGLSFKVKSSHQLNLLSNVKQFEEFSCEITFHKFVNQNKGIIYIQKSEFNELEKKTLKEAYPLPYGSSTYYQPSGTAIYYLYIPRQPSDTGVYKYQDRPIRCHNCHKNIHKQDADEKDFAKLRRR